MLASARGLYLARHLSTLCNKELLLIIGVALFPKLVAGRLYCHTSLEVTPLLLMPCLDQESYIWPAQTLHSYCHPWSGVIYGCHTGFLSCAAGWSENQLILWITELKMQNHDQFFSLNPIGYALQFKTYVESLLRNPKDSSAPYTNKKIKRKQRPTLLFLSVWVGTIYIGRRRMASDSHQVQWSAIRNTKVQMKYKRDTKMKSNNLLFVKPSGALSCQFDQLRRCPTLIDWLIDWLVRWLIDWLIK